MEQWLIVECLTVGDPKNLRFIVCFKQKCFGDLALAGAHTYIVGPTHLGSPWWIGRSRWKPRLGWYLVIPTADWLSSTFQKLQWKVGSLKFANFTWCTQQSRKLMSLSFFWHKLVQMEQRFADWHLALSNAVSIGQLKCFGKEFLIVTIDLTEKHGSTQVATKFNQVMVFLGNFHPLPFVVIWSWRTHTESETRLLGAHIAGSHPQGTNCKGHHTNDHTTRAN